jgi:hypothetical protein
MYLFTRSRRADPGDFVKAMESVGEITEQARKITGQPIEAWTAVMSPEVGTVVWTLWAERMAVIEQGGDALAADSGFQKLIEKADDHFEGPYVDNLATLVHGTPDLASAPQYVTVATATAANGRVNDAIMGGIEIADLATKISGFNTLFLVGNTGPFGSCAWITGAPDVNAVDDGESALNADPEWVKLIDRVGPAFTQDAAQAIYRRLA